MDEALRRDGDRFRRTTYFVYNATYPVERVGNFDLELVREFWQGFANAARCNLHQRSCYGQNGTI